MTETNPRVLAEFSKNGQELIRLVLDTFQGRTYLDIRCWLKAEVTGTGKAKSTPKGLTLDVRRLPEFLAGLEKAILEIEVGKK
jgi:hypothetical protein